MSVISDLLLKKYTRVTDSFKDTNGVLLDVHVVDFSPDAGLWSFRLGTMDIQSNVASYLSAAAYAAANRSLSVKDCGINNYTVQCIVNRKTNGSPAIAIRHSAADDSWFSIAATATLLRIHEITAASAVLRTSGAIAMVANTNYFLKVNVSGSVITAIFNGVVVVQYSLATRNPTSANVGISTLSPAASTFDNFGVRG